MNVYKNMGKAFSSRCACGGQNIPLGLCSSLIRKVNSLKRENDSRNRIEYFSLCGHGDHFNFVDGKASPIYAKWCGQLCRKYTEN
jgi:hypothetical protein